MNVAVERLPESQILLDITTDDQEFAKALDRAYRKVVTQVRLPGFRPGKAPRRVIEQMLGRDMLVEQADRDLLDPLYQQALEREQITPVSEPDVEIYQVEPLAFKVTVQVYPAIDLGAYRDVRAEPRPVAVTDEQVEETLERLRAAQSPWSEPTELRPARDGDRVTVDVTVRETGSEGVYREPLTDSVYVLGKDNLFEELHAALLGANVGDTRSAEITFADDNEGVEAGMRGKTMAYTLDVKKIEEQELLPLDDDFARQASNERAATPDALREDIRKDLLRGERQKARTEVGNEAIAALSDLATLELPAVMIDKQVDSDVENLRNHLGQDHNQTLEDHLRLEGKTLEQIREEMRPEAARRLRNSLVLREIATREGVSVGPQDIDAEIDRMAGTTGNPEQMRQFYSSNYVRNLIENEVFERKLLDRVIDIATEGRGPSDPPEEPQAEVGIGMMASSPADDAETAGLLPAGETEAAGILPTDEELPIGEAETVAATETVVPSDDEASETTETEPTQR